MPRLNACQRLNERSRLKLNENRNVAKVKMTRFLHIKPGFVYEIVRIQPVSRASCVSAGFEESSVIILN